ncbi:hypothetical protein BDV25DRAFT_145550 [Aspergillus avenaceus]|uniref:Myb-like domain-containing protein n=1 Tax=Aspergillus avenaceus TaxID=36643 RepID=A0A5N6TDR0_ASPAV|nr:hypothetical protein BDV25DRAFT_145550 [Aspergillus avenaceus]
MEELSNFIKNEKSIPKMPPFTPINGSDGSMDVDKEPTTPSKHARKGSNVNGAAKKNNTPSPVKKSLGPIPTSLDAASEPDKMILRMRDVQGKNWGEITKAYIERTGTKIGNSTLRMRYTTMKANFTDMSGEDEAMLLRVKKEVEERFEQEKWHRISDIMHEEGGTKYPVPALQKKFKELSKKGAQANGYE